MVLLKGSALLTFCFVSNIKIIFVPQHWTCAFQTVWSLRCLIPHCQFCTSPADSFFFFKGHFKLENFWCLEQKPLWCVYLLWLVCSFSLLHPLSALAASFISLSAHLCISSFWRLSLSPLHGHDSPFPAAWSGDRLACSWFNNSFVTRCLIVLQRSRLWSGPLKLWCACDLCACTSAEPPCCALIGLSNEGYSLSGQCYLTEYIWPFMETALGEREEGDLSACLLGHEQLCSSFTLSTLASSLYHQTTHSAAANQL